MYILAQTGNKIKHFVQEKSIKKAPKGLEALRFDEIEQ
jgi:hypothetical protein